MGHTTGGTDGVEPPGVHVSCPSREANGGKRREPSECRSRERLIAMFEQQALMVHEGEFVFDGHIEFDFVNIRINKTSFNA